MRALPSTRSAVAAAAVAATAAGLLAGAAGAGPITQDGCGGSVVVAVWHQHGADVLENLLFASGSLWVSDATAGAVLRFDAAGQVTATVPGPSGGLAEGPAGEIYAGVGNSVPGAALGTGASSVVRFSPADDALATTVVSQGFSMANGMALDPAGTTLYVSNDVAEGLVAIDLTDANPSTNWSELTPLYGTNGLVIDPAGEHLYAAITFDQRSPIERIPLDDPAQHETAAQLSFGIADLQPGVHTDGDPSKPLVGVKGLDDMTRDGDGVLYPVANGTGELLRVDPVTGDACLITGGLTNPSSVRIAPESSAFADGDPSSIDFYVTEFSGAIRTVRWIPAAG